MYLEQFSLHRFEMDDRLHKVGKISVWLPHAWCGKLFLKGVTRPEYAKLEKAESNNYWLYFHCDDGRYNFRQESAHIRMYDGDGEDLVGSHVRRGALWDPKVAAELAKKLEAKLLSVLE